MEQVIKGTIKSSKMSVTKSLQKMIKPSLRNLKKVFDRSFADKRCKIEIQNSKTWEFVSWISMTNMFTMYCKAQ